MNNDYWNINLKKEERLYIKTKQKHVTTDRMEGPFKSLMKVKSIRERCPWIIRKWRNYVDGLDQEHNDSRARYRGRSRNTLILNQKSFFFFFFLTRFTGKLKVRIQDWSHWTANFESSATMFIINKSQALPHPSKCYASIMHQIRIGLLDKFDIVLVNFWKFHTGNGPSLSIIIIIIIYIYIYIFFFLSFNLGRPFMKIAFYYYQSKTPVGFWGRQEFDPNLLFNH